MKLVFLGTRGEIEARTRRHRMHTSLEVSCYGRRVIVDAGEDWRGQLDDLSPHAIVVTHAHPDHARGLKDGAPCPVHATAESWEGMVDCPIPAQDRHVGHTPVRTQLTWCQKEGVEEAIITHDGMVRVLR